MAVEQERGEEDEGGSLPCAARHTAGSMRDAAGILAHPVPSSTGASSLGPSMGVARMVAISGSSAARVALGPHLLALGVNG